MKHEKLSQQVIGKSIVVHKKLGIGFLEKVYENALKLELESLGLKVESQRKINVYYEEAIVGSYYPDLIIEDCIIIELKASKEISSSHRSLLRNYLKATTINIGLIINFGSDTLGVRRIEF